MTLCQKWVGTLPCVRDWIGYGYKGCRQGTFTFFVHLAYSILIVSTLQKYGMEMSANTVCIGVGSDVLKIDDVAPFVQLWRACAMAGMTWQERVVYIYWAHDLVRPYMVKAVANTFYWSKNLRLLTTSRGSFPGSSGTMVFRSDQQDRIDCISARHR